MPGMPKTDNNSPENKWSQTAAWMDGQIPVITSSPAIVLSKSLQIDANLNLPADHWLVFSAGNSFISAANTVTNNSVIRVISSAAFENSVQRNRALARHGPLADLARRLGAQLRRFAHTRPLIE